MKESLDLDSTTWEKILIKTQEILVNFYSTIQEQKGYTSPPQEIVSSWFKEPLPLKGQDPLSLLQFINDKIIKTATGGVGPNTYAYVYSGGNQLSTIGDFIVSSINQNVSKWHASPAMSEIEKIVIQWTAEMIGFGNKVAGTLLTGGSSGNLAGLTVARNMYFKYKNVQEKGLFGLKPFRIYCSTETHNCIDKSLALLGIGLENLVKIPVTTNGHINLIELENKINEDLNNHLEPFCVVGNAGTVNTGVIDDFNGLAKLARKYNMWFHIDGSYGALAASLPELADKFSGLHLANSIALDFHKWLYQPYEIGCILVKNWQELKDSFYIEAPYLDHEEYKNYNRLDFNEYNFQLSKSGKALKVWLSLKTYGFTAFQTMMRKDLELAQYLHQLIDQDPAFEICAQSDLAIVCFRYIKNLNSDNEINQFNHHLINQLELDGRVFITGTTLNIKYVLRACIINHRKQKSSIIFLYNTIKEVAKKLQR